MFRTRALLALLAFLPSACARAQAESPLRRFTGSHTRVCWVQDRGNGTDVFAERDGLLLMGLDSDDGRGERELLPRLRNVRKPLLSSDGGTVVFTDMRAGAVFAVAWDRGDPSRVCDGVLLCLQPGPDGNDTLYVGRSSKPGGKTLARVVRRPLRGPGDDESVWTQTPVSFDGFHVSADGTHASGLFPWPHAGRARLPDGSWSRLAGGCWTSLAPDNSYLFWVFDGAHRNVQMHGAAGENWRVPINEAPGVEGFEIYHPAWATHPRYMTVTGPYKVGGGGNRIRGGGPSVEIHLGRFAPDLTRVEAWHQVTHNDKADFFPHAWIAGGQTVSLTGVADLAAAVPPTPPVDLSTKARWPGNMDDTVFLWESGRSENRILGPDGRALRVCRVHERGAAHYGPYHELRLGDGAALPEDVDGPLLEACRAANALTIEAVITPDDLTATGPARIVSFSADISRRNFTLGQERDRLVLRLRTPQTGENAVNPQADLCAVEAGTPLHLVVTYRPGRLLAYTNGVLASATRAIQGGFENWAPMQLILGDEVTADRDWRGSLEGIAILSRALEPQEVAVRHALALRRMGTRTAPPRSIVQARLLSRTATPDPNSLDTYRRCLVSAVYEVLATQAGPTLEGRVQVAEWAILDARVQTLHPAVGQTASLALEPMTAHPQLSGERLIEDEPELLDAYYRPLPYTQP